MVISIHEQWLMLGMSVILWMILSRMVYRKLSNGTTPKNAIVFALMAGAFGVPLFWLLIYLKFVVHEHGFIMPEFK